MDQLFSLKYGIGGICVLLTLMVLTRVGEFLWRLREKKDSLSEGTLYTLSKSLQDNTTALILLELRLKSVEASLSEIPKVKNDLRRAYTALKELAGNRWPGIRDEIMKDV